MGFGGCLRLRLEISFPSIMSGNAGIELKAFCLGAVAASTVCALVYNIVNMRESKQKERNSGASKSDLPSAGAEGYDAIDISGYTATGFAGPLPKLSEEYRAEQLSRNVLFFGEEGMAKIRGATVVVVGLGGGEFLKGFYAAS